jgi:uncharacterized protein (DUF433 family)
MVSGVGVREVNRAVDEGILKGEFTSGDGRRFSPADCMAMTFYFGSAKRLTSEERLFAIASAEPRLARLNTASFSTFPQEDWIIRDTFLTIDMGPFLQVTAERLRRLTEARAQVTSSSEILGGMPVITGTRIPVHDIAASRVAGYSRQNIFTAYPTLTAEQIDLAILYAEANPLRGRPRTVALPTGATLVSELRVSRRVGAG